MRNSPRVRHRDFIARQRRVTGEVRKPAALLGRCKQFTEARDVMRAGHYPYFVPIESSTDTEVMVNGEKKIMVGSNNYLGLTHHPHVVAAARSALEKYGSGCTGSRFLNGNLDLHEQLETRLARFIGTEAALVFSTGYQTNIGVIATLVGRNDKVYLDKLDHASIVDGSRLAGCDISRFAHGDFGYLRQHLEADRGRLDDSSARLVIVDGVFSMEGDIVDLPALVELSETFGADIVIDDAHAIGYLGPAGAGTASHFGLTDRVLLTIGTFSKSLASIGGFVAGSQAVIHYLRHHARTLIFSAGLPPASAAVALAALDIIEWEPERRERLWKITRKMSDGFRSMGFDIGATQTPIIPVIVGSERDTFRLWKSLFEEGLFVNAIIPPAVPGDSSRIRTSYSATHTDEQLDYVLETFGKTGRKLGII